MVTRPIANAPFCLSPTCHKAHAPTQHGVARQQTERSERQRRAQAECQHSCSDLGEIPALRREDSLASRRGTCAAHPWLF